MNRQSRALLVLLLVGGLLGWGWWIRRADAPSSEGASTTTEAQAPVPGGRLLASVRAEPRSFNRLVSRDFVSEVVAVLTQARLVRVNRGEAPADDLLAFTALLEASKGEASVWVQDVREVYDGASRHNVLLCPVLQPVFGDAPPAACRP